MGTESKPQLVEQINSCLDSGDYSRALDWLRGTAADFPNDTELAELEKRAENGVKRNAEADRLITKSQELFAERKSAEAIRLLREAYELDKNNALARSILANALVEHAHSIVETDWLEAEKLANQALQLNPAHPTAKTILNLIVEQKETSSVEDWVSQAGKLQSSDDLFAALAWVAEGLAVHPHDPKLLQIQDAIQRDQDARRRQTRRGDLEDLRRLQHEIDAAADVAAKQALAERIQAVAAKYWTDGEILSIANALLLRLGLVPQDGSSALPRKGATVILHVPRSSAPKTSPADTTQIPPREIPPREVRPRPVLAENVPTAPDSPSKASPSKGPLTTVLPSTAAPSTVTPREVLTPPPAPPVKVPTSPLEPPLAHLPASTVSTSEIAALAAKATSLASRQAQRPGSHSSLILVSAAAIIACAAVFFFTRKHPTLQVAKTATAPAVSAPGASAPPVAAPIISVPPVSAPAPTTSEPSSPAAGVSSDISAGKVQLDDQPTARSGVGSLVVVAGQEDARVFLNGRLQRQLTRGGQLRLPNLEPNDYVVQVSKNGFQDTPLQKIRIRQGEQTTLVFNLQPQPPPQPQPQPRLASLTIQGGTPGTTVFVDQTLVGSVQPDGTLSVSTVNPGDHTVELRKERFKPRQFKERFVAGGSISLPAADAALEAAPGELKITFAPADAKVAIVKGDLLTVVSSGTPLNLAPGTYTLTARTADKFTRWSTLEVVAGESKTLDLSLAPGGMSKWDEPGAWKPEKDSFIRKGGDFVLYGAVPAAGTFVFSATPNKGHLLQWVLNYTDPKNYVLFQMDDKNFYRTVIRNGQKTDEIKVPENADKKRFYELRIRVNPTELIHQIKHDDGWTVLDRWTQPGANLSQGKFGFYIPGDDQVALSGFAHYADLNIH